MAYLIYCSYEVGGLPYAMAEVLNRNDVETYYVSTARRARGHDSTRFHFGDVKTPWDISASVSGLGGTVGLVRRLVRVLGKLPLIEGCLATGSNAYLLKRTGLSYKYWSYGSDLDQMCFWPSLPSHSLNVKAWLTYAYYISQMAHARQSIRAANAVMIAPYQHEALQRISPDHELFFLPHIVPTDGFEQILKKKSSIGGSLRHKFGASHLFFSSTRHYWGGIARSRSDNKGNDVILRAFAKYRARTKSKSPKLVLVRKGPSVESTARLAASLGIEGDVIWIDEARRDELDAYYLGADLCFGQFGNPVLAFSAIEPLACATPVASFIGSRDEQVPLYDNAPPLCNSMDHDVIAEFMRDAIEDETKRQNLCFDSWSWANQNCSERAFARKFIDQMPS